MRGLRSIHDGADAAGGIEIGEFLDRPDFVDGGGIAGVDGLGRCRWRGERAR